MVWGQIATAVGKTALKLGAKEVAKAGAKATGKALIKKGAVSAAKHVGKQHLAKEQRKAVRREKIGYGERGSARYARKPMDIENV